MRIKTLTALLALTATAHVHAATTYSVTSTADSGPQTLREVIATINANTAENIFTIQFAVGSNQTILINSNLPWLDRPGVAVSVDGSASPGLRIDGQGTSSLFTIAELALFSIKDLTLHRGESDAGGCLRSGTSGVGIPGAPVTVTRVLFSECTGGFSSGGAIHARQQLNVTDSVFLDNSVSIPNGFAAGGAAIAKLGAGNLIVQGSTFVGNRSIGDGGSNLSALGGAIYVSDNNSNHNVRDSWFDDNEASNASGGVAGFGGAVLLESGGLLIERAFFRGNHADREGGAVSVGAVVDANAVRTLRVRNSTFERNTSETGGAIMFGNYGNQNGVFDVRNSLFQFNAASFSSPSIEMRAGVGTMNLSHTAFGAVGLDGSGNAAHCSGPVSTSNANATLQGYSIGCGASSTSVATLGLVGSEPSLPASFPVAYDMALTSPLLDAGVSGAGNLADPAACLTTDARGQARPQSIQFGVTPRCDIGPVELLGPLFSDGFED